MLDLGPCSWLCVRSLEGGLDSRLAGRESSRRVSIEMVGSRLDTSAVELSPECRFAPPWEGREASAGGASLIIAVGRKILLLGGEGSGVGGRGD